MSFQLLSATIYKLLPFILTIIIYFKLFIPDNQPSWGAMIIKCAPILSLMVFVNLQDSYLKDKNTFSSRILRGLVFSCGGDALLIWPSCFLYGMISFAIAQIFYIKAFGFQNLNLSIAALLFSVCFYVLSILLPGADDEFLIGLPVYTILLVTMLWRAASRAVPTTKESWSWLKLCSCVGGFFFVLSDAFIGFDRFHAAVPDAQLKIMSTYYIAQLGIALSTVDPTSYHKGDKSVQSAKNNNKYEKKTLSETDKKPVGN